MGGTFSFSFEFAICGAAGVCRAMGFCFVNFGCFCCFPLILVDLGVV